jgi:gluconokinase
LTYLLAIDIGTTSTKGLAVTSTGEVIALHQVFYPTLYPQPGHVEQDPEIIFQAVLEAIREVFKKSTNHHLAGICFSAAMHSVMGVDENGNPITPLIIWADTRSATQSKKIKALGIAQQLYEATGTPVHPMSPLCKLLWWKENQPEIIEKAHKFISIKEFVVHRLTGEYLIDYSTASATGLFDSKELKWSAKASELHQLPKEKFSIPVSIYHQVVGIHSSFAKQMRIDRQTRIIVGASDGCSAQLGSGAMKQGELAITLGTSGAVRSASHKQTVDGQGRIFNYILDNEFFVCGGATNNGTALLNWYAEKFDPTSSKTLIEFIEEVSSIAAGADGLIALPFLLGERAPMYDPDARGVFFGVSMNHTRKHFQRALIEGICFELKSIVDAIEQSVGQSKKIIVSGGFTHSAAWVQILSNILGRQLVVSDSHDASALGAAAIGFKSLNMAFKMDHAAERIFYPDKSHYELYEAQFEIFETVYLQLASSFEKLSRLKR